ncbi:hypothetical protein [Paracoccus sp. DMF]|uniref:hypothetical protein n=1 Tax=Paracoccus sp. DMF TaxID=400837 RepID=UPI0011002720|nr:hypothetical protein [Paracoccus sp. DMF]MCV2447173.1 hypothetical protein [Paracoccus sp. DMF]
MLLEIPAATAAPTACNGTTFIRVGNATPRLTDEPQRYQRLIERMRPYTWEHGFAATYVDDNFVLRELDYASYFSLTEQRQPESNPGILERLQADQSVAACASASTLLFQAASFRN